MYELLKSQNASLGQKFFGTIVMDSWNVLNDRAVLADAVTNLTTKLANWGIKGFR